ncbi:PD-(D/E)XK nuclease family protein [Ruminococcus sp. Marseille-P6503]|uniref:PD-(D/E)XK nuclease family protein n=1 Tax=Ruminococcus sp. Marseille-P6503 TaxID=2364796 RepID=UPI000F53AB0F|nr:PD-(D/E)XK nuclease family protein [Ruminococcus sp. Marseille-P6503]
MLRLITGAVHSGREPRFCEEIKSACRKGGNVLVIVPDQFSFEYDKKLYELMGASLFNRLRTAGFNRLAELISREYGAGSKENADENARIITMYKAVRRLKESRNVRFYKRALDKGTFLGEVIALAGELMQSGITPEDLRAAAEKLNGSVCDKLFDLSALYGYYLEELAKAGLKDALTSMGECVRLAESNGFFYGTTVFIDAFSGFSQDEYRLIGCMLSQAEDVFISLVISDGDNLKANQTPFAKTVRTREKLRRIAEEHNAAYAQTSVSGFDYGSQAIEHINRCLYCTAPPEADDRKGVRVLSASDIYEETEFVCAEVSRLIREKGYRYRDIAVAARDLGDIAPALEGAMERYDIPYFIDRRQSVEQTALAIYLKSIFSCVLSKEYKTENILRYIKSPLSPFYDFDVCDIEDYCVKWNVRGSMWLEDFTACEKGSFLPERLNDTRRKIIEPLESFKKSCENATAKEICEALFRLLDEIRLSEEIYSVVKQASGSANDTELELGRISKMVWTSSLSAVQSIYEQLGEEILTLRRFYEIFKLMLSQMTAAAPPQKADSVRCAEAERSRLSGVKALFILEVNDGVFPADPKPEGLLTERERRQLESVDLEFESGVMSSIENERLTVYQTASMPSDRLYIISSESDAQGNLKNPSVLVKMILNMFKDIGMEKIQDLSPDFFCTSYKTAYYKYLEKSKDRTAAVKSIEESLKTSEIYRDKLDFVKRSAANAPHKLSPSTAGELFFGRDLNISATRITDFYNCPFSFYCKYGLKLYPPQRVAFNNLYRGNLIHSCLERIMSAEHNGRRIYNENFVDFPENTVREKIHEEFERYCSEEMGGSYGKTARFRQELKRLEESAYHMIRLIQTELSQSMFRPEAFEFNLTKEDGESILKLTLENGCSINIRGSIDRADIYTASDGSRYLRIIDYKTGSTAFDIAELYSGLNLQMMIYLLAVTRSVNELNPDGRLQPSAVIYNHLKDCPAELSPADAEEADDLDGLLMEVRAKKCRPDGMMVDDENTIKALNKSFGGAFTLFSFNKDGSISSRGKKPADPEWFKALERFALGKVYSLAERLFEGDIKADPVCKGEGRNAKIPCSYCDYWGICGNASPKNPRRIEREDAQKLEDELKSIMEEQEKGGADKCL